MEINKNFETILKKSPKDLKSYLRDVLETQYGKKVTDRDGFLYCPGTFPVMLVAHMDTVYDEPVKEIVWESDRVITASDEDKKAGVGIGGDDRCGVYMILELLKYYDAHVCFVEDEEIGLIGASKFAKSEIPATLSELKYIIEIDRKGINDAVFYNCDNEEFEKFITDKGYFILNWGSCSDISVIAPAVGCAAVNISSGYNNEHHASQEIIWPAVVEENIAEIRKIMADENGIRYKYIDAAGYTDIQSEDSRVLKEYLVPKWERSCGEGKKKKKATHSYSENYYGDISFGDQLSLDDVDLYQNDAGVNEWAVLVDDGYVDFFSGKDEEVALKKFLKQYRGCYCEENVSDIVSREYYEKKLFKYYNYGYDYRPY